MTTGQSTDTNELDIQLTDKQLLELIKQPLRDGDEYWNKTFGLEKVGEDNKNLWLPNHWKGKEVFDYQEMSTYMDPRIFTSTETITATVNARVPTIEIMPAQDTEISLQVAKDLQKTISAFIEKYNVMDLFKLSVRGLQIKRGGWIKLRFDPNKGEHGEIVCEFVQREDCIVDMDAKMGEIPRFFAHKIRNHTVGELIAMFPDSEQKILEMAGCQRRNKEGNLVAYKKQLGIKKMVYEVWYRYMDKGATKSGKCVVDELVHHVLDNGPNPNWNYDAKKGKMANILDEPAPPFIPINFLNDGSSYFDQTSLIEQAASLQCILDKRGFQIMENADQAGSGLVFNTQMIKKSDIEKLTGSPDERIGVKGNVRDAVARVAPPPLPNYVIDDKMDARNEIDNVFATHDITRGESSKNPTLGQDNLQRRGDMTRMDELARAVERQASGFSRYLVQMMKVYYTEDHYFKAVGEDGQFDYVVMRGDLIENGIDIRVAAGSMLPIDKNAQQKWVSDLVTSGLIDPLSVYEVMSGGNLPSPKKLLERWIMSRTDPLTYAGLAKADDLSREALLDIQVLNSAKIPKQRDEYAPAYLKFMNNYMALSGEFANQPPLVKNMYIEHLSMVQEIVAKQMEMAMTQMPSQDELDMQAQKTAEQAVIQQQMSGGAQQQEPAAKEPQQSEKPQSGDPEQLATQLAAMSQGAPAIP